MIFDAADSVFNENLLQRENTSFADPCSTNTVIQHTEGSCTAQCGGRKTPVLSADESSWFSVRGGGIRIVRTRKAPSGPGGFVPPPTVLPCSLRRKMVQAHRLSEGYLKMS